VHAYEKLMHHYQVWWSKHLNESHKMEVDYLEHRWTTWFLWKEGIKPSDISCREFAAFGERSPVCSTMFKGVWCLNNGKEIAQAVVREWYRNPPKEWFCEDVWKFQRRWQ
jgi:hypothetical protein